MSNTKWRRFFEAISNPEFEIDQLVWKFVDSEHEIRGATPPLDGLGEKYISGSSFSVFPYKEIQWVEIPFLNIPGGWEKVPFKHRPQDAEQALKRLNDLGTFEIERHENGIRIFGYR
jgi:hypothetical protein